MMKQKLQISKRLRFNLQGITNIIQLKNVDKRFRLAYKPTKINHKRIRKKQRELRLVRMQEWEPNDAKIDIPHIQVTFSTLACVINPEESIKTNLARLSINNLNESNKQSEEKRYMVKICVIIIEDARLLPWYANLE